jgi:hypothetical protein
MIEGFEDQTHDLNDYEMTVVLPAMVRGLQTKFGEANAITSTKAIAKMKSAGYKITPARFRKIINHIRIHGLIRDLISTSRGYYITTSKMEKQKYLDSLRQRIQSITAVYDAMEYQMNHIPKEPTPSQKMETAKEPTGSTPKSTSVD